MTGRLQKDVSWRSEPDVPDVSPREFYFIRLSRHGCENRKNSMAGRNRYHQQALYRIGGELARNFASHASYKLRCGFWVRSRRRSRTPCAKAVNLFRHRLADKVIERDAVAGCQKLGSIFQRGRKAKSEADTLFFVITHKSRLAFDRDAALGAIRKQLGDRLPSAPRTLPWVMVKVGPETLQAPPAPAQEVRAHT
jgi:hypothetical protein